MSSRVDFGGIAFVCAALFLAFIAGALLVVSDTPPSGVLRDAYKAGHALYAQQFHYSDPYASDLWNKARDERRGVTVNHEDTYPGLTLYTSGDAARAVLIDLEGNVVHEWQRPFSTVWDETSRVRRPVSDRQIYFRKAHMFPNGDLLALYEGVGDSPYGYGMARLTAASSVVWKNLDNLHHDFDITPSGNIVTLSHAYRNTELPHADQFEPPYTEDALVVLGPDGRTLHKLSLLDALNESPYRSLLWRIPYYSMEDPLHANAVDYLDAQTAEWLATRLPVAREGLILVSMRELAGGAVALVDIELGQVVWASRGPWLAQHDPDVTPRGTLQVFDNRGNVAGKAKSRIIEVDPATMGIVWSYVDDDDTPFDSPIRGAIQRLDNENVLITESTGGRLLEIDRAGRIVWEYVNPVRGGTDENLIPVLSWGTRIPESILEPDFVAAIGSARRAASGSE